MSERETLLARTFVDVADTLVVDFDVLEFLTVLTRAASSSSTCPKQA